MRERVKRRKKDMDHLHHVKALRKDDGPCFNCAQALMMGFCDVLGISEDKARQLGAYYGGGMIHGSVCGTVSAALMILSAAGFSQTEAARFLSDFRKRHGSTQCVDLLTRSAKQGIPKKTHCDGLIFEVAEYLDALLKNR